MSAPTCACGNAGRYVNARGELCCATCPIKEGVDSVRVTDVPLLLAWCRWFMGSSAGDAMPSDPSELRGRIYRAPKEIP